MREGQKKKGNKHRVTNTRDRIVINMIDINPII